MYSAILSCLPLFLLPNKELKTIDHSKLTEYHVLLTVLLSEIVKDWESQIAVCTDPESNQSKNCSLNPVKQSLSTPLHSNSEWHRLWLAALNLHNIFKLPPKQKFIIGRIFLVQNGGWRVIIEEKQKLPRSADLVFSFFSFQGCLLLKVKCKSEVAIP